MTHYVNGNDNGPAGTGNDHKVIAMPTLAQRDAMRRESERQERKLAAAREPIINMPPVTKYLLGVIISLYLLTGVVLSGDQSDWVIGHFGFIPEKFADSPFDAYLGASLFAHMFLHGSWMHIIMNGFMLAAFGSGVERWLGARRVLALFIVSGLVGALAHYVLNTNSPYPMIGASGGLSGLFAAAIVMLNRGQREMGGRFGILPFALIWIGVSVGFGMLGGPDGSQIAWAAHVGGFLGGLIFLKILRV